MSKEVKTNHLSKTTTAGRAIKDNFFWQQLPSSDLWTVHTSQDSSEDRAKNTSIYYYFEIHISGRDMKGISASKDTEKLHLKNY